MVNAGVHMHVPSIVGSLTGIGQANVVAASRSLPKMDIRCRAFPACRSEVFMAAGKTYDVMIKCRPRAAPPFRSMTAN